jgi:putative peptidoglycan lipid II flippase
VFGIALATVVFPELSRYAVRKDLPGMARTASHALRLALFIGVPASVGIILLCEPLIRLVFAHGRFTEVPDAVNRVVWVANLFALGIWSYSVNHILNRTFYAMEQIRTPRRVAVMAAGLNFVCNIILVWPMAEGGLALATVISACFQTVVLAWLLNRRCAHLEWRGIAASAGRTLAATAAMGLVAWAAVAWLIPMLPVAGRTLYAAQLFGGLAVGAAVFFVAARLMKMTELRDLVGRAAPEAAASAPPADNASDLDPPASAR